jgi:alanine dehydrogenase
MKIGILKEIKNNENRVCITPENTKKLILLNNEVFIEKDAGIGSGFSNEEYKTAGAIIIDDKNKIIKESDLIVKVKEPIIEEYPLLDNMKNKTLFAYLHLAAAPKELTLKLIENNITSIAFETVEDKNFMLPLLKPMSEVAGVLAIQYGSEYLQKKYGGVGKTLGLINGANSAKVVVIGGGISGAKAAITAAGHGSNVTLIEINENRILQLKKEFYEYLGVNLFKNIKFIKSTTENISNEIKDADLIIGAVLIKGAKAPIVVNEKQINLIKNGAVIVDIAIDQGGCIFGSKPTTHENPIYNYKNKIYCCITNMPGQVSMQSTQALSNAILPYIEKMSKLGIIEALKKDEGFKKGINVYDKKIVYKEVATALNLDYHKLNF